MARLVLVALVFFALFAVTQPGGAVANSYSCSGVSIYTYDAGVLDPETGRVGCAALPGAAVTWDGRTSASYDFGTRPTESYVYDSGTGLLISDTDNTADTSSYVYDGYQRLDKVVDGLVTQYDYHYDLVDAGLLIQTDIGSRIIIYRYDANDRLVEVEDTNGSTTRSDMHYDSDGRLSTVTDPDNSDRLRTQYQYDSDGRISTIKDYDSTDPGDPLLRTTRFIYDSGSGRLTETDQDHDNNSGTPDRVVRYFYDDGLGNPITRSVDPDGNTTTYSYDAGKNRLTADVSGGTGGSVDMLYIVPVPAPGAALLFGLAVAGLVAMRRRALS
jgi:YD repeat-containing protein